MSILPYSKKKIEKKVTIYKKIYNANINQKKAGVVILVSDKADFRTRNMIRNKAGYYIMKKGQFSKNI